ncbi:VOC family protein [Paenibacillus spongiae]|uniref:VOC domain-containing protein n=1 Tax=Paenibacillus spongiae TaxID=2909671 RepID=A0ABY5S4X9_9BACL|nr:VOC family protein [Paenibacillus spongiae]UVI28961.1 hypothetical protein L1F29_26495 [Paenibacillus spongiae]
MKLEKPLLQLEFVQLPVPNVIEAAKWYIEHLGFLCDRIPDPGVDMCFMGLPEGGLIILKEEPDLQMKDFGRFRNESGFYFKTRQIESIRDYLQSIGVEIHLYADNGFKFLTFSDPYGNVLGLIEDVNKYDEMAEQFRLGLGRDLNEHEESQLRRFGLMKEWELQDTIVTMLAEINKKNAASE